MKFNSLSRRFFLQGAAGALVLPVLPSLLSGRAFADAAAANPVRFLQVFSSYGPSASLFYGSLTANQRVSPNVNIRPLTGISGALSPMIGADFNSLRSKFSVLRGLDVFTVSNNHNRVFASCASSYAKGLDGDRYPPVTGQVSADTLMANSTKVYASTVPVARRQIVLAPSAADNYSRGSFSYQKTDTKVEQIGAIKLTQALYDTFASGFSGKVPVDPHETALLDSVMGDYRALRDGGRLSTEDKNRLESYVGLVNDIEQGLKDNAPTCAKPTQVDESVDVEALIDNQFRILAATMACDLTRVASITLGMTAGYDVRHPEHHAISANPPGIVADFKLIGARVARLLKILDATHDGAGTLLDNSVVYWASQYGIALPGNVHTNVDMPVVVAGGGRGQLSQGRFIDYRAEVGGTVTEANRLGIGLNHLLVTFMNTMGMSSADYESTPGGGYGYFDANSYVNRPNASQWDNQTGRRAALPVLYSGPARG